MIQLKQWDLERGPCPRLLPCQLAPVPSDKTPSIVTPSLSGTRCHTPIALPWLTLTSPVCDRELTHLSSTQAASRFPGSQWQTPSAPRTLSTLHLFSILPEFEQDA